MKDLFGSDPPLQVAPGEHMPRRPNGNKARERRREAALEEAIPAQNNGIEMPPKPRRQSATRSGEAAVAGASAEAAAVRHVPCARTFWDGDLGHRCSVGGGYATCTLNGGITWECDIHVEPRFWASAPVRT